MDDRSVEAVCKDVWDEFTEWDRRDSERTLELLCTVSDTPKVIDPFPQEKKYTEDVQPAHFTAKWKRRGELQWEYRDERKVITDKYGGLPSVEYKSSTDVAPRATPFPPYESCTPITDNVWKGDDSDVMSFVPFSDEPAFDHEDCQADYLELDWQRDPGKVDSASECYNNHVSN